MSAAVLEVFDTKMQKTNDWLGDGPRNGRIAWSISVSSCARSMAVKPC